MVRWSASGFRSEVMLSDGHAAFESTATFLHPCAVIKTPGHPVQLLV